MENFRCSSSSFDALNSFQGRRSSSVVVIAENDSVLSPTFRPFKTFDSSIKSSKRGSKIFHKRNKLKLQDVNFWHSQASINLTEPTRSLPTSKSAAPLTDSNQISTKEAKHQRSRKQIIGQFFKKLFKWQRNVKSEPTSLQRNIADLKASLLSSKLESVEELCSSFSYEKVIAGQIPFDKIDMEKIEVNLMGLFCRS
jgi:hypothetical protein